MPTNTEEIPLNTADVPVEQSEYVVGRVVKTIIENPPTNENPTSGFKRYDIKIESGKQAGQTVQVDQDSLYLSQQAMEVHEGDRVVISVSEFEGVKQYVLTDAYRFPSLMIGVGIFFALAVLLGRKRGFMSFVGLCVSILVIVGFIIPQILAGKSPFLICLSGAIIIATTSLFPSHGFNKRTTLSYLSTILTLLMSAIMAAIAVSFTKLYGTGSEDSLLVLGSLPKANLSGLLLGGIILGILGVLDDITTAQTAVVEELKRADPKFRFKDLYHRGLSVGREHIASLINTLFLAYAGASLPLFLLFSLDGGPSLPFLINNEMIAEELVRTLVGSSALLIAVPLTTAIAAWFFQNGVGKEKNDKNDKLIHNHPH